MPSIKRKICAKCKTIYTTKSCEQCKKENAKVYNATARSKESAKVYHSTRWRKVRKLQLESNPLCINFAECGNVATIADHIIELKDGGEPYSLDNLRSVCQSCHNKITAQNKKKREVTFRL